MVDRTTGLARCAAGQQRVIGYAADLMPDHGLVMHGGRETMRRAHATAATQTPAGAPPSPPPVTLDAAEQAAAEKWADATGERVRPGTGSWDGRTIPVPI
ncbi:MAG TPA: hypothetical protein QF469_08060 [Sphingomonas sanguinis]|uniref:hypothetical protein n=1 Tax=Sphingomonas sanguinis TaxID=33051 RepID=UPI002AC1A365|nr:hypothetical protein [Sphingomonas sanguinis]